MSSPPRLDSLGLWNRYEGMFLELIRQALGDLADCPPNEDEDDLNRRLYKAVTRAAYRVAQEVDGLPGVIPNAPNPPAAGDEEKAERESKRPDFTWSFVDNYAASADDGAKQFVLECKRLTAPDSRFTREYVVSGIDRFLSPGHGYAAGMPSGAMIGYLQQIEIDSAVNRINVHSQRRSIPPFSETCREGEARAEFEHSFARPVAGSPFRLFHLWARVSRK